MGKKVVGDLGVGTVLVPLALIDRPKNPHRLGVSDDRQLELERSMRRCGLICPIAVVRRGQRYEVIAGDRRVAAARSIGWVEIEAKVFSVRGDEVEGLRFAENFVREDVNKVDLAVALGRMVKRKGWTGKKVAKAIGMSEQFVSQILGILKWPECLIDALAADKISFSAARELAKITDEAHLSYYLRSALESGCTPRLALQWRSEWEARAKYHQEPTGGAMTSDYEGGVELGMGQCFLCAQLDEYARLQPVWLHRECRKQFLAVIEERTAEGGES